MATETPVDARTRGRDEIPEAFTWNLSDIYPSWSEWEAGLGEFERMLSGYAELRGTLGQGPERLLKAFRLGDDLGQLSYKLWYYAGLTHDQDQRDNAANARRQRVQILFAKAAEARSWFTPELLRIPLETARDVHSMLANADIKHPVITLHDGTKATLTYGQYNALLQTNRHQADRSAAFHAFHETFAANANTYAAVYNGVLQRDWFIAQARQFKSTLDAALHGNDIPPAVVENLVATAKAGTEPLRRYHRLRKHVLGLETYHAYDQLVPLVDCGRRYDYSKVIDEIVEAMAPLGDDYQREVRRAFEGRWIDVYENPGKRSGAYSAPVYGVHPYMLLNYNDTLDSVFTLAHEMGHSMHTMLSEAHQPFVYSDYTIFVAEVPSTLSEMLFFDHMLSRTTDQRERIVLLQHAIDDMVGTFYRQCLFADYELQAHRLAEQGEPITAEALSTIYFDLFKTYHGDAITHDDSARITWARVPHFFGSPYYVYQYATCYASSAQLIQTIASGSVEERRAGVERILSLP